MLQIRAELNYKIQLPLRSINEQQNFLIKNHF